MNTSVWKQKKVFVTGSTGFIGKRLVETLQSYGAEVLECQIDLLKERLVSQGYGRQEYVFHLAAKSPAATDTVDAAQIIRDNVSMAMNVLEFAQTAGAAVVVASSSHVYPPIAGKDGHPLDETETAPGKTMSALGTSKQETENVCLAFGLKHGVKIVLARMSNVYGPGDRSNRFVPTFARKCLHRRFPLEMMGSGETMRDFVYIDDAIAGLLAASQTPEQFEVFNIGGGAGASMAEVAEVIKHAAGLDGQPVRYLHPEKSNISYNVLHIGKASKEIAYAPKISLAEGMGKTVSWWKTHEQTQ